MNRNWTTIKAYEDIRFEYFEGIAKITINRPQVYNAFRPQTVQELIHAFVLDVKQNQKQLDSLIMNNKRLSYYYDSMVYDNGFGKRQIDLIKLSDNLDFKMYRFINKKTIFEQMKSSGALRYIQDKEILKSMLRYEENADYAERRSMDNETDHYNNRFRTTMDEILPLSFYKYISEDKL